MAVTMSEIAKRLNISVATVSRALSGKRSAVSEETRRAVLDIVRTSGYRRRKTRSANVSFVVDKEFFDLNGQFYARVISGIEEELSKHQYRFQFHSVDRASFDLDRINIDFGDLAGVMMVGVYHDDFVLKLRELEVPMVLVDFHVPTEDMPTVLIDNTDGILKACRHLASLGHRRIAYISGDEVETSTHERLFGYERAIAMFGFESDPALVVRNCKSRIDEGYRAMQELLRRGAKPTAVVAYNDLTAAGALDATKQAGLAVPGDVSLAGFDDIRLAAEMNPALTTIHVPKRTMGTIAARRIIDIIRGRDALPHKTLVPTRLVVRDSTGAMRK